LGKLERVWYRRFGELIVSRDISHRTNTPLFEESRISTVLNEEWVVAEAGLRLREFILLLST
jgi:hypothetical protein